MPPSLDARNVARRRRVTEALRQPLGYVTIQRSPLRRREPIAVASGAAAAGLEGPVIAAPARAHAVGAEKAFGLALTHGVERCEGHRRLQVRGGNAGVDEGE